ncbi:MAG: hypothetical protein MZV64_73310 [Ignavibacteriales bacterium]|nr:hypothetical protein [Ignavibacteriales bacterium]
MVAIISAVQMFFLFMMIVHKNPFETFLVQAPADGRGPEPAAAEHLHGGAPAEPLHRVRGHDHSRTRSAWRRSSPGTWTTPGCAPSAAGRW